MRQYQQIPARIRYFISTQLHEISNENPLFTDQDAAFLLIPKGIVGSSLQYANNTIQSVFGSQAVAASISQGLLMKDLGRQFFIYNSVGADAALQCVYRQVEVQQGLTTEGNNPALIDSVAWIKVWQADGGYSGTQQIFFVRTG